MTSATKKIKQHIVTVTERGYFRFVGQGDILVDDLYEKHSRHNSECKGPGAGTRLASWRSSRESGVARAE